jgi:hypothetical protein
MASGPRPPRIGPSIRNGPGPRGAGQEVSWPAARRSRASSGRSFTTPSRSASFFTGLLAALPTGLVLLSRRAAPHGRGRRRGPRRLGGDRPRLRFALRAGRSRRGHQGGLFSSAAGPWGDTLLAAARLLALWAAWAVPFVAWELLKGAGSGAGAPVFGLVPYGLPRLPFLLSLWSGLGVVLSFAFVAVAAAAPGFGSLFSPALWRTLFGGRLGELFLAIAGVFGPPLTILLVVLPASARSRRGSRSSPHVVRPAAALTPSEWC